MAAKNAAFFYVGAENFAWSWLMECFIIRFMMIQMRKRHRFSLTVLISLALLGACEQAEQSVAMQSQDNEVKAEQAVNMPEFLPEQLVASLSPKQIEIAGKVTPHKALYDIELLSAKNGSQILDISGQMLYELQPACDGWVTNHHFKLDYQYADGISFSAKSDFSTFEHYDGSELTFLSRRGREGEIMEEIQGRVINSESDGIRVEFQKPQQRVERLSPQTRFPIEHSLMLLQKINEGQRFINDIVFDGSDDILAYEINAFIGESVSEDEIRAGLAEGAEIGETDAAILKAPAHRLRMAFFDNAGRVEEPDYEMSFALLENNLVTDMVVEYSDFSVRQSLKAVEALDWPDCGTQEKQEGLK